MVADAGFDSAANLVERYEYTPYGERKVFASSGANDLLAYAHTTHSQRFKVSGVAQAYAINQVGHQGLQIEDATCLISNRNRILNPRFGLFIQRDNFEYIDGASMYQYEGQSPLGFVDPWGNVFQPTEAQLIANNAKMNAGYTQLYNLLKSKCDACVSKCDPKSNCTIDACDLEAKVVASAVALEWIRYADHPWSWSMRDQKAQTMGDARQGWVCFQWRWIISNAIVRAMEGRDSKCIKIAGVANAIEKAATPEEGKNIDYHHWWNTATVGDKAEMKGDCTVHIDPWTTGSPEGQLDVDRKKGWEKPTFIIRSQAKNPKDNGWWGPNPTIVNGDYYPPGGGALTTHSANETKFEITFK